ncbi:UNVERIFIED_CONTAM: Transcription factor IIIA [Sesamum latifolium]|uniref:Transcription factor IIIA n=1 Tax=Sesamum latifolium TaxID=2727402 RepID=A0AAW2XN50_9LAMI
MEIEVDKARGAIFRDIRRYYCEYCGICRSKKSLISSHILTHHQEEMNVNEVNKEKSEGDKLSTCEVCGSSFRKPAHLKQHMQSHSLEGNMKRHIKELHQESSSTNVEPPKEYICPELGCGKVFKYLSKLRKHEDSHVKLDTAEAFCSEPGCMKYFTNKQSLKEHLCSCHQYIVCDKCGSKQLKKNFKRHLSMHEAAVSMERIKCSFNGCLHTFATESNLNQHMRAVHLGLKPYACSIPGCHMKFAFKHVRDKHEKSGCHVYTPGNFEESDEQFRSRHRGGRKRKCPAIESLLRKRVVPPSNSDLSQLLSADLDD